MVDYSFFDRGEYFELTVGVNQVTLLQYDQATRDEIAASIQESVRTLLFPGTQQDFLEVSL